MPIYKYKVSDAGGKVVVSSGNAKSKEELASTLTADGFKVLSIKKAQSVSFSPFSKKISLLEKANFFRFLSTMLRAGLSISEGFEVIKKETQGERMKKILSELSYETRRGGSMTATLSKHKDDFDPVIMAIVKVGEESGTLDKSFEYLSQQLSASYELNQKVKGSLVYPAVIIAAMVVVGLYMLIGVLPKVAGAFSKLKMDMPLSSEIVMNVGVFVGDHVPLVLGTVIGAGILTAIALALEPVRKGIFSLLARIKTVRRVLDQIDMARYSRTLSTLTKRGVSIVQSLEISADTLQQTKMKNAAQSFAGEVTKGKLLSQALMEHKGVFPPILIQTVQAGEKTGMLDQVLAEMAEFYENEVERSIKKMTTLLEPVLILGIGVVVGAMVITMIAPIYNVIGGLQSSIQP